MRPRESSRTSTVAVALLGGAVTELAFPGRSWWPAAIVGVALLVVALRRDNVPWGALVGFVWGLGFFFPHLFWLDVSVGVVPWVALVLLESVAVAGFGALWVWCRRSPLLEGRPFAQAGVAAALWLVVEEVRSLWPFGGFPWGRLAFSQTDAPALALAFLGGAPLVSAAVVGAGSGLALALVSSRSSPRRTVAGVAAAAGLTLAGLAVPLPSVADAEGTLRVAAVQGNVVEPGLNAFAHRLEVLRNHVDGTYAVAERAGEQVDVVLWPENASDVDPRVDVQARALVEEAVDAVDVPVLVGTLRYDALGRYNDSVLWAPDEGAVAVYTKQHPAPFGEYIPMRGIARMFSDKVDLVSTDMLPGGEVGVVPLRVTRLDRTVPLATAICFEVAYDGLVRDAVRGGGEVIVVQTNNASFGWTQESVQQLAMTRLRAVEHGRSSVQVSTVGVSGVVAPDGTLLERTELFTADQLVAEIPLRSALTPADRLGPWPVWVALAATALTVASAVAGSVGDRQRRADRGSALVERTR